MKKMAIVLFVCLIALGILFLAYMTTEETKAQVDDVHKGNVENAYSPNVKDNRKERVKEFKKALQGIEAAQRIEKDIPNASHENPWLRVPEGLDKLLEGKKRDSQAEEDVSIVMSGFLNKYKLNGTKLISSACVDNLCKLTMHHQDRDDFYHYVKNQTFLSLNSDSNFFARDLESEELIKSYLWVGRDGFELPLHELHDREDFLQGEQ